LFESNTNLTNDLQNYTLKFVTGHGTTIQHIISMLNFDKRAV